MKIALDLDGVLADLQGEMVRRTEYDEGEFESFGDHADYEHFMSEAARVWNDHWETIDPVEPRLGPITDALAVNHTVDIVTNTAGSPDAVGEWLAEHEIAHADVVHARANGHDKYELDYDAYIDDKPALAGQVDLLYLRDRPWNQSVRGLSNSSGGYNEDRGSSSRSETSGSPQYVYDSYETCYIESEGRPEAARVPHVIRITSLLDVVQDFAVRETIHHNIDQ